MLQLCSVVIFDNFVVLASRLLVIFHTDFLLCNKSDRYIIYIVRVCCMGLGARSVVNFS